MLTELEQIPPGFLEASPDSLHQVLSGPTLIHLAGRRPEPLFVSVLLHGNEYTGLKAIQKVIARHAANGFPRALSIFVGNVEAAALGQRRLDTQPDYNRIWPGADAAVVENAAVEHEMMTRVVEIMRERRVFASIDVHNNTGLNPHYGCVNALQPEFLHLANLFSQTIVYFLRPLGVQSAAFAKICPSTTVECGKPGESNAESHAASFIEAVLHLDHFPSKPPAHGDFNLFHTVAVVRIPADTPFGFENRAIGLQLDREIDHFNFRELKAGTRFGRVANGSGMPVRAIAEDGRDVTEEYFRTNGAELQLARDAMPSMLTLDERIIRQDCLCYLMERYTLPWA